MSGINGLAAAGASAANASGSTRPGGVTLQDLRKQYPHLKMTAQAFGGESAIRSYAQNQSGKYNVAIHPKALERMGQDEEFGSRIHDILSFVKEADDNLERFVNANGATLVASGTIIDANGEVSMWSSSRTTVEGPGLFERSKKSMDDLAKKMEERRTEKKDSEKKAEEKRLKALREATATGGTAESTESITVTETVEVKSSVSVDFEA